jgi:glycosyltransferase involved in cell wall biosynthesis
MKIAFLRNFTLKKGDSMATDMIGYGVTVPGAIIEEMRKRGVDVIDVTPQEEDMDPTRAKLWWTYDGYKQVVDLLMKGEVDSIFIFHIFHHFPSELRRVICDTKSKASLVGYTHGSHWDPSDTFRFIFYPKLELLDLANLYSLDTIFLVSEYFRGILGTEIAKLNQKVAKEICDKISVVGLPINTGLIDKYKKPKKFDDLTVVFNHNLISSKDPVMFVNVMDRLLKTYDLRVIFTRSVCEDPKISAALERFKGDHPNNVSFVEKPGADPYYPILWQSHIQVSTASHETLGVATLESMYTDTCCILPNHCSYPEITGYYEDCLYEYNEQALYDKLKHVIEDESARNRIARELKKRVEKYYPENVTAKILKSMQE